MVGESSGIPRVRTRASIRQAFVAAVVSAAVVGGVVAFSGSDDGRSVELSPTLTTTPTVSVPIGAVSSVVAPPGDTLTSLVSETIAAPVLETGLGTTPIESANPPSVDTMSSVATDTGTATTAPAGEIPAAVGAPAVSAKAYAVYDSTTGTWLAGNQADAPLPVGSVMKLLTSYVVLNAGDPEKVVTVPQLQIDINESAIGLYAGEQLPRDVLFRAMIIVSANDAARALATDIGGSIEGFVQMMNAAAVQLGLSNTVAANPIGLDAPGAHSSARDVIELAALLMQDQTFREAVIKQTATLHKQVFPNTNRLLTTYDGADGIKTGHTTQAGYCLVASATRNGRRIIVAVLGSPSETQRFADAASLLDWAFQT